jgi:hypothetical protein
MFLGSWAVEVILPKLVLVASSDGGAAVRMIQRVEELRAKLE